VSHLSLTEREYRSILNPETIKKGPLVLPIRIWDYDNGGIGQVGNPEPNKLTMQMNFPDPLDIVPRKNPINPRCLSICSYGGALVTACLDIDEQGWLSAKQVCQILNLGDFRDRISNLDDSEKFVLPIPNEMIKRIGLPNWRDRDILTVSESGLKKLLKMADKAIARDFEAWTKRELLPGLKECILDKQLSHQQQVIICLPNSTQLPQEE